jgi:putative molybdopterin biosynthesis protein
MQDYLTTKELAALLRIKERKVYDLAASGQVPCSKAMGKLLFPRAEIEAWIANNQSGGTPAASAMPRPAALPNIVLGSHDPMLDWALRESRSGLATFFDGSIDGLERFAAGEGLAAGIHIYDETTRGWNTPNVLREVARRPVVVIEWARRSRGLVLATKLAKQVSGLTDLNGVRLAGRQSEAGAQVLFESVCRDAGIAASDLDVVTVARSEQDVALAVAEGEADACFGLRALADQYHLAFVPIIEERFDLVVDRRAWFEPGMQTLLAFCRSDAFKHRAHAAHGYDFTGFGTVHFNGP